MHLGLLFDSYVSLTSRRLHHLPSVQDLSMCFIFLPLPSGYIVIAHNASMCKIMSSRNQNLLRWTTLSNRFVLGYHYHRGHCTTVACMIVCIQGRISGRT